MARTEVRGGQITDASVSLTADVFGVLPEANGGTGGTTVAANAAVAEKVVGPASSVDNQVVRFDGTTGKLVQAGHSITIDDSSNLENVSRFQFAGAWRNSSVVRTSNLTLNLTTHPYIEHFDATSGNLTITMPTTTTAGYMTLVQKIDSTANTVTLTGTINGQSGYVLTRQYEYVITATTSTSGTFYIVGSGPSVGADGILVIKKLTQAAYDALGGGVSATTLYVIVG